MKVLSLQVTLCVNIVYLLVLSTTTLPLYSLVVQMGGDFKGGLLPPDVRARLEAAAEEVWVRNVCWSGCVDSTVRLHSLLLSSPTTRHFNEAHMLAHA